LTVGLKLGRVSFDGWGKSPVIRLTVGLKAKKGKKRSPPGRLPRYDLGN